ncbi:hypothetical protein SS15_02300 [Enterobacter roggenkampii]|uniref:hypothetical protein n=1 Tax=Enterobacter roggenkampii TaxID=1812935 RepID=UPI0005EF2608|nr:hypothetical protein [Enterobacter roggenkampii]KJM19212.1 hypothetical protein SS15_02300 [Enterobacter roggenkampii]
MAGQLDEAAKQILATLLADFTDRNLTVNDLKKRYIGPQIVAVETAVCNIDDITKVDFDVAFRELEKNKLIHTGPMEMYKNRPGSRVIAIGSYSKREFVYLTEEGYKAARRAPNRPERVNRVINHVHISGGQFSNLQLAAGENVKQSMSVTNSETDYEIISKLISILEEQGQVVSDTQRSEITAAVAAANEGDGKQAKSLLEKVCGPVWESVQPVMWPIVGELIKKSLGL